jgi:hypothetical protein
MTVLENINSEIFDNVNDDSYNTNQGSTSISILNPTLPVKIIGDNNIELLLFEKDLRLDPNVINGALFNWTEHIIYEKTVNLLNRTVNIVGPSKSKEQLRDEFERAKTSNPNITSIKQIEKQLPICGDVEARMYFAILKLFHQNSINNLMPRKIFTTYQEIKNIMGLSPTFPTPDLKDSLFRLAHTRYEFKESFYVKSGEDMAAVKQSHSLYLLNYYELEIEKLKEKINDSEEFEDFEPISEILKTLLNKRGKPTATLLKITLDEEQWKNLSRGYNLLYSYEHLKLIPKPVARGLYLFLDPNQGVLFTNGRITRTNFPNVFMVKAQYIVEYLGSSETNPTKSLNRVNKALDILKKEGYIKKYGFITNSRRILEGIYEIEFFPEQSRSDNKYASFMVKANPNAFTVPMTEKKEIDFDFEKIMEQFYTLVGGERLMTASNRASLKSIYYDENNIKIASYMTLLLDKPYGYYYLNGILYAITTVKSKDLNALIKGIIFAENNPNSKKSGFKNHSNDLMKKDFILKYGQDKFEELSNQVMQDLKKQFTNNSENTEDTTNEINSWVDFVRFYKDVYYNDKTQEKINHFNIASQLKIVNEYKQNKYFACKLVNYVLSKGKDINAYLAGHGTNQQFYVYQTDADILKAEHESKIKLVKKTKEKKQEFDAEQQKEFLHKNKIESQYNQLTYEQQQKYARYANEIITKYGSKLNEIFKENSFKNKLILCIYATTNGSYYDRIISLYLENTLLITLNLNEFEKKSL